MNRGVSAELAALMDAAARAVDAADWQRAEPLLRRIVAENPGDASAWHMLAVIAIRHGRPDEAINLCDRAVRLERSNALFLSTLGVAHAEAGHADEATRCFKRALKERPDYAEAHYNLGKVYAGIGKRIEAERCYTRARRLDPKRADVLNNLSLLYCQDGRDEEALALLAQARAASPDDETVAINHANALLATAGPAAAIAELTGFVARRPDAAAAHASLGRKLLAEGRYLGGWREYSWRHGRAGRSLPAEVGRVLLLPAQGLGDHLFFLRFAGALRARARHIAFLCPDKLLGVLDSLATLDEIRSARLPGEFDLELPLDELPGALGETGTPPPVPMSAEPSRVHAWRARLADLGPPPYLAVTWRAGGKREDAREHGMLGEEPLYKEVKLSELAAAVRGWRGSVLIVQRVPLAGECEQFANALGRAAHDVSSANDDLAEMAALLSLVDEYVGVSNTNMHVRAGLARQARVLVPFPPEFRWMHGGTTTPWFPEFLVYRQTSRLDWRATLKSLERDLTH
jgi:Flp pilus assembly protein TadD